jgi:hypothetical protein
VTEPVISADLIDWTERQYISQFSVTPLSLTINIAGAPADPDGNVVQAQLLLQNADGSSTPVTAYTAARENTGVYTVTTSSQDTATPADAALAWSYSISSAPQQYMSYLVIGRANPNYDGLPINIKDLIELVWIRFADCFDSPAGGPNLQTYYQAHWSRGRVAQLMQIALMNLNTISQPFSQYSLDGSTGPAFPTNLWGGLLGTYTYVQCLKQLIRSWTEQPNVVGAGSVTRLDRRDYTDRWRNVLKDEEAELKSQLDMFKIRHMGLGNPRVLVSGGVYGRYAPTRIAGSVAARPRMWARWY